MVMARRSPKRGVMKPRVTRPTVRPAQKPVAAIPAEKMEGVRVVRRKEGMKPPRETWMFVRLEDGEIWEGREGETERRKVVR